MSERIAYSIQPATWRDFRELLTLERACFEHDPWPWMDVLAALTFPDTVRLKATAPGSDGGRSDGSLNGAHMVGFVIGDRRRAQGVGWVASIGVHPVYQGRGLGARLLQSCEVALGTQVVRLTLRPSNRPARRLYERAGYVEIDRLSRYYTDGEDGVVMEKMVGAE